MFDENYNSYACEEAIKKVAKAIYVIGIIWIILSFIAFIVVAAIDGDILWLGAVIMVALAVIGLCCMMSSHAIWGFGDIVGNTKKIAGNTKKIARGASADGASADGASADNTTDINADELPKL